MIKGLTLEQEEIIKSILNKFNDYQFFYYGSRVKGDFVKSSDLDILVKGPNQAPLILLDEIKEIFYNSKLPFIVNVADFYTIDKNFYDKIKADLIPV